jgi:broad specificity phosphatase PhoE
LEYLLSSLTMIRHGQAGSLEGHYDVLSDLGREQARRLAEFWRLRGVRFDAVYSGSLERQRETSREICDHLRGTDARFPEPIVMDEWNEYPGDQLTAAWMSEMMEMEPELGRPATESSRAERAKAFQRAFEVLMGKWVAGTRRIEGAETWSEFHARVIRGLERVTSNHPKGARVAVFSSGGAIAVAIQHALSAPERTALELNWAIWNCAVSEILYNREKMSLAGFNHVDYLPNELMTYR